MVPPATIKRALVAEESDADTVMGKYFRLSPFPYGSPFSLTGAQARGLDLVHYLAIRTPVELVIFLRNLSAYLQSQPSVSSPQGSLCPRGCRSLTTFLAFPTSSDILADCALSNDADSTGRVQLSRLPTAGTITNGTQRDHGKLKADAGPCVRFYGSYCT